MKREHYCNFITLQLVRMASGLWYEILNGQLNSNTFTSLNIMRQRTPNQVWMRFGERNIV